jgi:hypothetical protein
MYNTTSMLRTIEVILGLKPMTQFDAAARPMLAAFQSQPDNAPYTVEQPRQQLDTRNPATPASAAGNRMDFEEADRNDDDQLNDILWRAIRKDPPPPPVRSYFSHE